MKIFFAIGFALVCLCSFGQEKKVRFGGSFSIDNLSYSNVQVGSVGDVLSYKGGVSYALKVDVIYEVSSKVNVSSGLSFENKKLIESLNYDFIRLINPDDPLIPEGIVEFIHSNKMLNVPIFVKYQMANRFSPTIGLLNFFRLKYSKKTLRGEEDIGIQTKKIEYSSYYSGINFGLEFKAIKNEKIEINVTPHFTYFINKVHDVWFEDNPVQVGVRLSFLKL